MKLDDPTVECVRHSDDDSLSWPSRTGGGSFLVFRVDRVEQFSFCHLGSIVLFKLREPVLAMFIKVDQLEHTGDHVGRQRQLEIRGRRMRGQDPHV